MGQVFASNAGVPGNQDVPGASNKTINNVLYHARLLSKCTVALAGDITGCPISM